MLIRKHNVRLLASTYLSTKHLFISLLLEDEMEAAIFIKRWVSLRGEGLEWP